MLFRFTSPMYVQLVVLAILFFPSVRFCDQNKTSKIPTGEMQSVREFFFQWTRVVILVAKAYQYLGRDLVFTNLSICFFENQKGSANG